MRPDPDVDETIGTVERAVFFSPGTDPRLVGGFSQVPNVVLRLHSISAGAKVLYAILLSYAWQSSVCWPDQAKLAEDAGCTDRNVRRELHELEAAKLIRIHQRGFNRPNLYEILPMPRPEEPKMERTNASTPDRTELSGPVRTGLSDQDRTEMSAKEYSGEEYSEDSNKLRNAREGARECGGVVPSAAPAGRTDDTSAADGATGGMGAYAPAAMTCEGRAQSCGAEVTTSAVAPAGGAGAATVDSGPIAEPLREAGDCTPADPMLLADLLARVPGLGADVALGLVADYGALAVRRCLGWLEAKMAAKEVASPAGWLIRALRESWTTPPASFARAARQEERRRRRAAAQDAVERQRAEREAQLAEASVRLSDALTWFDALPQPEKALLDAEVRRDLGDSLAVRAVGVPELPEVLTARGLTSCLWRDRLVSRYLAVVATKGALPA